MLVVVGAFAVLLFATVATSDPVRMAERGPSMPFTLPDIDLTQPVPTTTLADGVGGDTDPRATRSWELLTAVLENLLLVGLAIGALLLARNAWRHRPQLVWHPRPAPPPPYTVLEELATSVVDDAAEQRALLRRGTARNGIVECWLRLEATIEASGVVRDPTLTPTEFASDVLGRFDVDAAAVSRLVALYREARFSTHELDEANRADALAALDAIHDGLRRARTKATSS